MSAPFLGEIKLVAFSFAPEGWAMCNGQLLPINQNQALFSILGTMYGGNGQTTFALPNLRGRVPLHQGPGFVVGQAGGEESHTLLAQEMPSHSHAPGAAATATTTDPTNAVWAATPAAMYAAGPGTPMRAGLVGTTGSSQPHPNLAPLLVLNAVIALTGVFPSRA